MFVAVGATLHEVGVADAVVVLAVVVVAVAWQGWTEVEVVAASPPVGGSDL